MAKRVMDVRTSDNKYLHRDFHVSGDNGIRYIGERYGDNGVKEYLRTFAQSYYKPLVADVQTRGLTALKEQIESIYEREEMPEAVKTTLTDKELTVEVSQCPAVTYFKSIGYRPSKWYVELTRTVDETIADLCGLGFEMIFYCEETGKARYRFFRRAL